MIRISVIIPNYNDVRIARALRSVHRQTYRSFDVTIMDGGSTRPELLEFYSTCGADTVIVEKDEGIFDALNKGVASTSGDVVFLMGADDELSDEHVFASVARAFAAEAALDGVCIGCEFVNSAGRVIRKWYPSRVSSGRIKRGILPPHFSLFLRRDLYTLVGEFTHREYGGVAADTFWLLELANRRSDLRIRVLPQHHLRMEYGGASTGSLAQVVRQFRVVHDYVSKNARHLSLWFLFSPVRTLSKLTQLRVFRA